MSLIPWSRPGRSPAVRSRSELDDIFRTFFEGLPSWPTTMWAEFSPSIDVKDDEKEITVTAELPGIDKKDVDVQVRGDELVLRGEKREEKKEEKDNWVCKEIVSGSFVRRISLPAEVDVEHADAKMDNGVLTIHFPKKSDRKAKSIKVA
jgi:HSP20 family protein